ncbi:hypothetical protein PPYR_10808 [Photinus pyralis]|uniref:DH domain-containing protein n=1 Tax=Photinus pyralis TaxID=7054 RepID=A0A5N4AHF1_PHOPY|nr:putative protein tag-52 [Photinus pyralis]KAB0796747.1 hypothetical protein PPYR_10808 [Photinus pyralis]
MENINEKGSINVQENCTPDKQLGLSAEIHHEILERNMLTTRTKQKILTDLYDIKKIEIERYQNGQRDKILSEILSSEISYQRQLTILKDHFMAPLKEREILTNDEYDTLFCNVKTISNISSELIHQLETKSFADAFSKIVPFFKHYSVYAYHYKASLQMLQNISKKNAAFAHLLEMQESRPEVQSKLSALLITPIQRIPRYCLLLEQLIENTPSSHDLHLPLIELHKTVESVALHLNSLIEDQENAQLLLEFQRSLLHGVPSIVRPGRKLIKKGVLTVVTDADKKSKKCVVLMSDILMYCKIKKNDVNLPNSLKCYGIFPLNKCKLVKNLSKGAFTINCEDESLTVYHEHASEIEDWVRAVDGRIKQYLNERRTLRKDSSSRRPAVHKRNLEQYQEVGVSPGVPRRKRLISDQEKGESATANTAIHKNNSLYSKPTKRRCIKRYFERPISGPETKQQDCLYPLRELALKDSNLLSNTNTAIETKENNKLNTVDNTNNDVFVFGSNTQSRGFTFRMKNAFNDLRISFQKFFGFHR